MATRTPRINPLCYPRGDAAFVQAVSEAIATLDGAEPSPAWLTERLRGPYPRVSVVPQEAIADLWHNGEHVWYVYRDGGLLGGDPTADA